MLRNWPVGTWLSIVKVAVIVISTSTNSCASCSTSNSGSSRRYNNFNVNHVPRGGSPTESGCASLPCSDKTMEEFDLFCDEFQ